MKIQSRSIPETLKNPSAYRGVLIYGPDESIARDYLASLSLTFTQKDPGTTIERIHANKLKSEPYLLGEALSSFSLLSSSIVVVLEDTGDNATSTIKGCMEMESCQNFLIVIAEELGPRSSLRMLFEKEKNLAAIACYEDNESASRQYIAKLLREKQITFDEECVPLIFSLTGNHRGLLFQSVEKIAMYLDPGERLTIPLTMDILFQQGEASTDDFCFAVLDQKPSIVVNALDKMLKLNKAPVSLLRSLSRYIERLIILQQLRENGKATEEAFNALRPPVFFMHKSKYEQHLSRYSLPVLLRMLGKLTREEKKLKLSPSPSLSITQLFLGK